MLIGVASFAAAFLPVPGRHAEIGFQAIRGVQIAFGACLPWTIFLYTNNHLRDLGLRCKDSVCILVLRPRKPASLIARRGVLRYALFLWLPSF